MPRQILLLGINTMRRPTRLAFRMRVSMSAIGSWLFIACLLSSQQTSRASRLSLARRALRALPACLLHARDLAGQGELTQHDAGDLELPQRALRTAGQLAAVVRARRARITRQLGNRGVIL